MLDGITADTRIGIWVPWAGADHQLGWLFRNKFIDGDLVVSEHRHIGTFKHQVLVDIPSKGVIVVDQDEIGTKGEGSGWWGE